jgi:hypothetical protein
MLIDGSASLVQEASETGGGWIEGRRLTNISVTLVKEGGNFLGGVGCQGLDGFAGTLVQGADGVVGDRFANRFDG